jgi:hypothetical protein
MSKPTQTETLSLETSMVTPVHASLRLALRGLASLALVVGFTAGVAQAQLLRPAVDGVVLDSNRGQAYAMNEEGGIDALDLATGALAWSTQAAVKPVLKVDGLLLAQATHDKPNVLALALLDETGTQRSLLEVALPEGVRVVSRDGLGVMFRLHLVAVEGKQVTLGWTAFSYPASGLKLKSPSLSTGASRPIEGAVRVDLVGARASVIPAEQAANLLANPPGAVEAEVALASPGTRTFHATDAQARLVSVLNADATSPSSRYRWTIFDGRGSVAGGIEHATSSAPFVLAGSTLLYVEQPTGRLVGDVIESQPLSLISVDLATGAELWQRELVDTRYHGPFPP